MTIKLSIQQQTKPTNCHSWPLIQSGIQAIAPIQNQASQWEKVIKFPQFQPASDNVCYHPVKK